MEPHKRSYKSATAFPICWWKHKLKHLSGINQQSAWWLWYKYLCISNCRIQIFHIIWHLKQVWEDSLWFTLRELTILRIPESKSTKSEGRKRILWSIRHVVVLIVITLSRGENEPSKKRKHTVRKIPRANGVCSYVSGKYRKYKDSRGSDMLVLVFRILLLDFTRETSNDLQFKNNP